MKYLKHLRLNWGVAWKCFVLVLFHAAHGLVPVKWTSHEHWGVCPHEAAEPKPYFKLLENGFAGKWEAGETITLKFPEDLLKGEGKVRDGKNKD